MEVIVCSLGLLALIMPGTADAAILEISPGDDIVTLTSSLGPGDEVIIADGVYEIDSTLVWSGAGTESEPIIIRASGTNAVIRQTSGSTIASIRDASFLEVRGLRLESSDETYEANRSTGIEVRNSTDISIRNNTISHVGGTGIYVGADSGLTSERVDIVRNQVEDLRDGTGIYIGCNDVSCTVLDTVIDNNWVHELSNGTGIYLANGVQGSQVVDNVVYQTSSWGLQTLSTTFGPSNVIERNVFWSNDHGIRAAGASDVRNNVVLSLIHI